MKILLFLTGLLLILALCMLFLASVNNTVTYYYDDFKEYLSDYRPYRMEANVEEIRLADEDYTPTKIWMLIREGVSYPRCSDELDHLLYKIQHSEDLFETRVDLFELFSEWTNEDCGLNMLTEEGKDEIGNLAKRMKKRFPDLFDPLYTGFASDNNGISDNTRTTFIEAILGNEWMIDVSPPLPESQVLDLPKKCKRMRDSFRKSTTDVQERYTYKSLHRFHYRLDREWRKVERRLHIGISAYEERLIYETFASETARKRNETSVWISALTEYLALAENKVRDLVSYYRHGYHDEQNYKPACLVLQEIVDFFEEIDASIKGKVYFTDNKMHLKLLTFLGLYNDGTDPLREDRKWKLSKIGGFATNLAFILFKRAGEDHVAFLHQERLVNIPECEEDCTFFKFKQTIRNKVKKCTFYEMCETALRVL